MGEETVGRNLTHSHYFFKREDVSMPVSPEDKRRPLKQSKYLMNTETREIYGYTLDLANMKHPKFVPFNGVLPPPDLKTGKVIAKEEFDFFGKPDDPTPEQRIDIIAGILHLIPKEDMTAGGSPALLAVEKMSRLDKVTRKEINVAEKKRADMIRGKNIHATVPEDPGAETDPVLEGPIEEE